jgi:hypothetical protein
VKRGKLLYDVLRAHGWKDRFFERSTPDRPFARVGLSFVKRSSVFEPRHLIDRLRNPGASLHCSLVIGRKFRLTKSDDPGLLAARWVEDDDFPYESTMHVLQYGLTEMKVCEEGDGSRLFIVAYAALGDVTNVRVVA